MAKEEQMEPLTMDNDSVKKESKVRGAVEKYEAEDHEVDKEQGSTRIHKQKKQGKWILKQ